MNIYLVGPVDCNYDEYDSFVVIASDEESARRIADEAVTSTYFESAQKGVFLTAQVDLVGQAADGKEQGVVLGSYNAG